MASKKQETVPSPTLPHIAIFPFMSKGHTIPLLHLAHILHHRCLATLTFFTTPLNAPFLRTHLAGTDTAIVELLFPQNAPGLPPGVESTDCLPSMSLFSPFVHAVKLLRPQFEQAIRTVPAVSLLISDGFIVWTKESADELGIPRMVFHGTGSFSMTISGAVSVHRPHSGLSASDERFNVPGFPNIWLTRAQLPPTLQNPDPNGPFSEFVREQTKADTDSHGIVVNSFYELEAVYNDRWNSEFRPKAWCIGPLLLAHQKTRSADRPAWMEWLDSRSAMKRPVLYVAFGTQVEVSEPQMQEIAIGLERTGLDFLWVVRDKGSDLGDGFEERVKERGRVVREWVEQEEILGHESVRGFISHCGWNSVLEGICAGVPFLAWPMMAEQFLNAELLVEELGIGLRVQAGHDGLVRGEYIERLARELVLGDKGKEAAKKVRILADASRRAVEEGGSSWCALELMLEGVCRKGGAEENGTESRLV